MADLLSDRPARRTRFSRLLQNPAAIIRLKSERNYCWIYFADQRPAFLIRRTLKDVSRRLPTFLRVNRQHSVNPAFVDYRLVIVSPSQQYLVLTDGLQLVLPRPRRQLLDALLAVYPAWISPPGGPLPKR